MTTKPSDPRDGDPASDATLGVLFRALAEDEVDGPAPDPTRVSAHLSGVGDAALLEEAARRPAVRRLLADVVVSTDGGADDRATGVTPALAARLIAAFEATVPVIEPSPGTPARAPMRALPALHRRGWARAAAAALIVLVPGGLVLSLSGRRAEAGPVLAVEGIDRVAGDGAVTAEGPQRLRLGARVAPEPGERMALRLDGGARVILHAGDRAHVACAVEGRGAPACTHAVLALDRGEALLVASPADRAEGSDVVLPGAVLPGAVLPDVVLPGGATVEILAGAAHVALDAGAPDGGGPGGDARPAAVGALALRADARVRFTRAGAGVGTVFVGPATFRVRGGDLVQDATSDQDALGLFRDLAFFGGPLRTAAPDRRVTPRQWRVLREGAGATRVVTRESDASGAPSLRMDLASAASARLAWELDADARESTRLTVLLAVRPRHAGPGGAPLPDTRDARVRVAVEGVPGAEAWVSADPSGAAAAAPGAPRAVTFSLPPGWARSVAPGSEVVLRFETDAAEAAGAVVWFAGLAFGSSAARPGASSVPSPPAVPSLPRDGR